MQVVWKLIKRVVDERLSQIELHGALHEFRAKCGCRTGIMEAKLVQQLAYREQCPLFGVFLDLQKAYDAMDRWCGLDILRNAGVGSKAVRVPKAFWDRTELACRASGYYGRTFKAWRRVIQGGPRSPTIFNLMVDAIVREWMRQLEEKGVDTEDIREIVACFYADDGLIAVRDPSTLQKAMDALVALFEHVGLKTNIKTNTEKTEAMAFVPGRIRTPLTSHRGGVPSLHFGFPPGGEEAAPGDMPRVPRRDGS